MLNMLLVLSFLPVISYLIERYRPKYNAIDFVFGLKSYYVVDNYQLMLEYSIYVSAVILFFSISLFYCINNEKWQLVNMGKYVLSKKFVYLSLLISLFVTGIRYLLYGKGHLAVVQLPFGITGFVNIVAVYVFPIMFVIIMIYNRGYISNYLSLIGFFVMVIFPFILFSRKSILITPIILYGVYKYVVLGFRTFFSYKMLLFLIFSVLVLPFLQILRWDFFGNLTKIIYVYQSDFIGVFLVSLLYTINRLNNLIGFVYFGDVCFTTEKNLGVYVTEQIFGYDSSEIGIGVGGLSLLCECSDSEFWFLLYISLYVFFCVFLIIYFFYHNLGRSDPIFIYDLIVLLYFLVSSFTTGIHYNTLKILFVFFGLRFFIRRSFLRRN